MDDTISRQQTIEAIFSEPLYKSGMKKRDADVVVPAIYEKIKSLPPAQPERKKGRYSGMRRAIYEDDVIKLLDKGWKSGVYPVASNIHALPSAQPAPPEKYEYHYDHTDCIWYRPEARNRCPSTCAQYRDGWNDAMNYIYRDGKGYRPYRRGEQYGE